MGTNPMAAKRRETFLAELALTANVAASARAAEVAEAAIYALRRKDAGFRRAWLEALAEGYAQLELQLLERALFGTPKAARGAGGREFSERLALALLSAHRDTVMKERARAEALRAAPDDAGDAVGELIDALDAMTARQADG